MFKKKAIAAIAVLLLGLSVGLNEGRAQDEFLIIDGNHWQELDEAQRVAFISGVMHVLEFERQLKGDAMMAEERTFVPHLIAAVKGHTVGDVSVGVTDYYLGHPDDMGRPVVATIVRVFSVDAN